MTRIAVLFDERDHRLGSTTVQDKTTFVIRHADAFFFRTEQAVRLSGGGIGVVFRQIEPVVRARLEGR